MALRIGRDVRPPGGYVPDAARAQPRLTGWSVAAAVGLTWLLLAARLALADAGQAQARGVVFHDRNGNGSRDAGEDGIAGVCVSNGREVVRTDADGRWELPAPDEAVFFVIKPSGWMTPVVENNLPRFCYVHRPAGSPKVRYGGIPPTGPLPESIDFPLSPRAEPNRFSVVFFADTQPQNLEEIGYVAHDVVEEVIGCDAAFGVTLGDTAFNDLSLFEPLDGVIGRIGLPWYHVIGNHDTDQDVPDDTHSAETFTGRYGPPYYSFDYGPVHFIALDDIRWMGPQGDRAGDYIGEIGPTQLEFVRNDLALVPAERLVVLMMHIPFHAGVRPRQQVADREDLFRLIEDRPHTFSITGHMHLQAHVFFDEATGWRGASPHHQVINGTVCGTWWKGAPDELGVPHATMRDGTPNGYSMVTFDGTGVSMRYQAARHPADYQMNIYAPDEIAAADAGTTEVLVNVFAGSQHSQVEIRVGPGAAWTNMEYVLREDPAYLALKQAEASDHPPAGRPLNAPVSSTHIWRATLPPNLTPGTHLIEVREMDVFGQTHASHRVIRVR